MPRFRSAILMLMLLLSACSILPQRQTNLDSADGEAILRDAVASMRDLSSFRMDILQGGVPYRFYFQLGPSGIEFVTTMTRAEGAFVAPDRLWVSARISVSGVFVNIGLFATSNGQWLRPLTGDWVAYEYAPGFDPAEMMIAGDGFQKAIDRMRGVQYIGREIRNGIEVLHLRGIADGDTVNTMLFGLLYILEDMAVVDIYVDAEDGFPSELVLTLPGTASDNKPDSFWQIEIYDTNRPIELDAPAAVRPLSPPDRSAPPLDIRDYLGWIAGLSAIVGAAVTPVIFRNRGRSSLLGLFAGGIAGALGSLFLLLPLWLLTPARAQAAVEDTPGAAIRQHAQPQQAAVHPWVVMGFIAIPVFVGSLDLTVVSAFLPELVSELGLPFDTGLDDASWVVTAYLLAYTISLTFMGRLSDLVGRKAVYVGCLLVFIVGSVWVAVAHTWPTDILYQFYRRIGQRPDPAYVNLHVIIIGRVVSALGAGALVPVSLALVGDIFPPDKRARPLGFVAAMDTLGWVLGPVYGGILMQVMAWQGLFWINVPLTLLALFSVIYALRTVPTMKARGRFDFIGTALIIGALSAMSIGLGANVDLAGGSASIDDLRPLPSYAPILLTAAAALLAGFALVETRIKDPLVNLGMFKRRNLAAASVVNLLVGYCLFIGLVSVPLLVNIRQESLATLSQAALQVGILLSTLTIPMAAAAVPGGWLADRFGIRRTIVLGLGLAIAGFLLMWQTWDADLSNVFLALQMAIVGVGIGLTFSPVSTAIINSAYDAERGVASALVIILRLIGMTVSISTLSSVMFYRVNALAASASSGLDTVDPQALFVIYSNAALQVLGEMGLVGAVLAAAAIIPALFVAQTVTSPED